MTAQFEQTTQDGKSTRSAASGSPAGSPPNTPSGDPASRSASPAVSVSAIQDIEGFPLASLHFVKVKSKKGVKKAFKTVIAELASELAGKSKKKKENAQESPTEAIKTRYTQAVFFSFTTMEQRALLMQRGTETASNPARYVDRLLILNEADAEEFTAVLKNRMQNVPLFWLFSADTKD